jgi:hypothetical protein
VLEQPQTFDSETIRSSVLSRFGRNAFRSALGALYHGDPPPSRIPLPS